MVSGGSCLECSVCCKSFSNRDSLKKHRNAHFGIYRYQCKFCDKGLFNPDDLISHESWHTGVMPFRCHICNASFRYKRVLRCHMLKAHQASGSQT
ncbi:hypothetical protein LSH36_147g01008 [Paralvinella palmiformis]|uniref:C2H2-type domain-containing protein n=1 Tax=Paralvinella palmiformis TaxID=53620 RepID=A0AAD9N978_9ANNE|nr:hypothetical protein LSH36_147g01008 [Paralvinella palmiformis]